MIIEEFYDAIAGVRSLVPNFIIKSMVEARLLHPWSINNSDEHAVHILSLLFPQVAQNDNICVYRMLLSPSDS